MKLKIPNILTIGRIIIVPIFVLTFPQKGMLKPEHYEKMATALKNNLDIVLGSRLKNKNILKELYNKSHKYWTNIKI